MKPYSYAALYNHPVSQQSHKANAPRFVSCYVLHRQRHADRSHETAAVTPSSNCSHRPGTSSPGHRLSEMSPLTSSACCSISWPTAIVHVIITTGGTGITSRDSTYEAIDRLLDKRLDGFGELFRMLSFNEIGPAAMMSRAPPPAWRGARSSSRFPRLRGRGPSCDDRAPDS